MVAQASPVTAEFPVESVRKGELDLAAIDRVMSAVPVLRGLAN